MQYLLLNNAFLAKTSVQLQTGLYVLFIQPCEAIKGHIRVASFLHKELTFPIERLVLCGKTTLQLLLSFAFPIHIAELNVPRAVFLVLECCHNQSLSFSSFGSLSER